MDRTATVELEGMIRTVRKVSAQWNLRLHITHTDLQINKGRLGGYVRLTFPMSSKMLEVLLMRSLGDLL